jgi:formate hydrogenlyase subunit 6/NADH:ubiquinone oxidoreductase subunit I
MFRVLRERIKQGYRTVKFPVEESALPERFRGLPVIDTARCGQECSDCLDACPTGAISRCGREISVDLGKCLFCVNCSSACGRKAMNFSREYRLAAFKGKI